VGPPERPISTWVGGEAQLTLVCDGVRCMGRRDFTDATAEAVEKLGLSFRLALMELDVAVREPVQPHTYYRALEGRVRGPLLVFTTRLLVSEWAITRPWGLAQPQIGAAVVDVGALSREAGLRGVLGRQAPLDRLRQRLAKVVAHELGHLVGLTHCRKAECCMALASSLQNLDRRGLSPCRECTGRIRAYARTCP